MYEIFMASAINTAFGKDGALKLRALAQTYIGPKGLLHVGIEVEDHGEKVPVFVYPSADTDAANHFYAVYEFFEKRGVTPVYYAPEELPDAAEEINPFEKFSAKHLDGNKDYEPSEGHAVWWATEEEPEILKSRAVKSIDHAYKELNGIETYVLAALLKGAGYIDDEEVGRAALPDEMAFFPLEGPEGIPIIMTASREKGIRFAFPVKQAGRRYRDLFLHHFSNYCHYWKTQVEEAGAPKEDYNDDSGMGSPLQHWKMVLGSFKQMQEKGDSVKEFGPIFNL